jgi:DNA-binding transcriptional LysR family regulator
VSLARLVRAEGVAAERELERAVKARSMMELLIGTSLSVAGAVIPGAITRFLSNTDDCRAVVQTGQFEDLLESLVKGEIDIVVCNIGGPVPNDVSEHILYQDDFVIVSGSATRLASEAPLDREALLDALWVLPPKESRRHADLSRAFASLGMPTPVARAETLSIELIRDLVLSMEQGRLKSSEESSRRQIQPQAHTLPRSPSTECFLRESLQEKIFPQPLPLEWKRT